MENFQHRPGAVQLAGRNRKHDRGALLGRVQPAGQDVVGSDAERTQRIEKILEDAQGSNDPEKRKALYWKAQEMLYEDAPIIKAYQQAHIFGISNRLDWTPWIDNMLFLYDAKVK